MRRPENFEKIMDKKFTAAGYEFRIESDFGNKGDVWVFAVGRGMGEYCLLISIDWENKTFSLRKCLLARGLEGENIDSELTLPIRRCKSVNEFVTFISEIVTGEMRKGTFNN